MANSITAEELKNLLATDRNPAVFDVRRKSDYEAAPQTINGAAWLDPEKADEWKDEIPRDRPVVVYLCERRLGKPSNSGPSSAEPPGCPVS